MTDPLFRSVWMAALVVSMAGCGSQDKSQSGGNGSGTSQSASGPTAEEVDTYLEGKLPAYLDVDDVKSENFIDPNTSEGRVSVSANLHFTEATYRDATNAEILDYLQQHGINPSERQLYLPFNQYRSVNMDHRLLAVITGPQSQFPMTTELQVKKTVEGWSLSGGGPLDGLSQEIRSSEPLKNFGAGALPMGSPEAEAYVNGAVQQKAATNGGEDTLLTNVRSLFTPGRPIIIHMLHPQSKRRDDITFTPEGAITLSPDGKNTFTVIGAMQHSSLETAPYRTEKATRMRIVGQLGHRVGTLAPNYVVKMDFFDPSANRFGGGSLIGSAEIFDKQILSTNGMYDWNWWTN